MDEQCRMERDGERCQERGTERFVPMVASLAGMQTKAAGRMVTLCDRCWRDWQRALALAAVARQVLHE